jgi:predicted GIY-YIG superfamily endonuclease
MNDFPFPGHADSNLRKDNPQGYVYLVRASDGAYKIGTSQHPALRMEYLQEKKPDVELTLLHLIYCADAYRAESQLHMQYSPKRIKGEWFALNDEDVKEITSIKYIPGGIERRLIELEGDLLNIKVLYTEAFAHSNKTFFPRALMRVYDVLDRLEDRIMALEMTVYGSAVYGSKDEAV